MLDAAIYYSIYLLGSIFFIFFAFDFKSGKIQSTLNSLVLGVVVLMVATFLLWNVCRKAVPYFRGRYRQWMELLLKFREHSSVRDMLLAVIAVFVDMSSIVLRHWLIFVALDIQVGFAAVCAVSVISFTIGMISMMPLGISGSIVTGKQIGRAHV